MRIIKSQSVISMSMPRHLSSIGVPVEHVISNTFSNFKKIYLIIKNGAKIAFKGGRKNVEGKKLRWHVCILMKCCLNYLEDIHCWSQSNQGNINQADQGNERQTNHHAMESSNVQQRSKKIRARTSTATFLCPQTQLTFFNLKICRNTLKYPIASKISLELP